MKDYWVTVCAECETASCWHGEHMCWESQHADIKEMKASQLRAKGVEHPCYFSPEKIEEVTGAPPRPIGLPTESERTTGLHARYVVTKASGKPVDPRAEYFVLRLDDYGSDPKHVAACRKAVLVYADAIEEHIPGLAEDIRERWGE